FRRPRWPAGGGGPARASSPPPINAGSARPPAGRCIPDPRPARKEVATVKTSLDLYRNEFITDDLAEAREFLERVYSSRLLMADVPAGRPVLAVSHTETGAFAVSDVTLPADLTFAVDPSDQVIISTVI